MYYVYVCESQRKAYGSVLPSTTQFQGLNLGCRAWLQVPLPTELFLAFCGFHSCQ